MVPGWASKNESEKVIPVLAPQLTDEAPERTQGSQPMSHTISGNSASLSIPFDEEGPCVVEKKMRPPHRRKRN